MGAFIKETDQAEVDFCLNCKEKKCNGDCEKLKREKERISAKRKGVIKCREARKL